MKNICGVLLIIICLITLPAWAADDEEKTISGTVADLDWVSSTMTVRYLEPYSSNTDEINIKVTGNTVMYKGTDSISFSDILQSDPVTVVYYDAGFSGLKAKRITDSNLAR